MSSDATDNTMRAGPWKCGDEFLPYHPQASHCSTDYRSGWNDCFQAARADTASQGAGWQPVTEKAPIGTDLLLHLSSGLVTIGMRWSGTVWDWPDSDDPADNEGSVLHWMHLPAPPADASQYSKPDRALSEDGYRL